MDALRKVTPSAFIVTTALLLITFSLFAQKLTGKNVLGASTIIQSGFPGFPHKSDLTGDERTRAQFLQDYLSNFWLNHE